MKKNKFILVLVFTLVNLLISTFAFAQQNKIDSLLSLFKKDKEDTNKINHLNKISIEYINIGSYDSAFLYGNTSLKLAQHLNFKRGLAKSYGDIGIVYQEQGKYTKIGRAS